MMNVRCKSDGSLLSQGVPAVSRVADFRSKSIFYVYSPRNFLVKTLVSALEFGHVNRSDLDIFFWPS